MSTTENAGGWSNEWQGQLDGCGGLDANPRKRTDAEHEEQARLIEAVFEEFAAADRARGSL